MNVEQLKNNLVQAASAGACEYATLPSGLPVNLYGWSISALLSAVQDLAVKLGQQYRAEIITAARGAIDQLVALDIPGIPDAIEATIDDATKTYAYSAVDAILDAILGPVAPPAA
jgi:hypothetical protein